MPHLSAPTHQDHRQIGDSTVSRSVAWGSVLGFLLLILSQLAVTLPNGSLATSLAAWWRSSSEAVRGEADQTRGRNARLHDAEERLEEDLTEASWLRQAVRAWGQLALTRFGGVGNTQVYLGEPADRGRWMFFAPATEHVVAAPFLDPGVQRRRAKAASAWERMPQTDPISAIAALAAELSSRGIVLIVVPAPSKISLEALHLGSGRSENPIVNPSYSALLAELTAMGVIAVDPLPVLQELADEERFLRQDSHWSPEAVEAVAAEIAQRVRDLIPDLSSGGAYRRRRLTVANGGDLVDLLGVPAGREPADQRIEIQPVFERNRPWQPDRTASVLLLGDSFSNVFSQEGLGWGSSAGLAEQLSYRLRAPVDKVVVNAGGAYTAREAWVRDLIAGERTLENVRVVVYEFAARELSWGDWRRLPLP